MMRTPTVEERAQTHKLQAGTPASTECDLDAQAVPLVAAGADPTCGACLWSAFFADQDKIAADMGAGGTRQPTETDRHSIHSRGKGKRTLCGLDIAAVPLRTATESLSCLPCVQETRRRTMEEWERSHRPGSRP